MCTACIEIEDSRARVWPVERKVSHDGGREFGYSLGCFFLGETAGRGVNCSWDFYAGGELVCCEFWAIVRGWWV